MGKQRTTSTTTAITFEEATAQLRQVLALAREEALRFGHNRVAPEHLLLGVLRAEDGAAARALEQVGIRLRAVREHVDPADGHGAATDGGDHSLTQGTKEAIILAMSEARRLRSDDIAAAHVLLGLCRAGGGIDRLLARLEITPEQVHTAVLRELDGGPLTRIRRVFSAESPRAAPKGTKANVVTCRIDDRDLDAIDALVEAGVRTTRSDAAAWLIHVGLDANRGLIDRVYSTVAEIRSMRSEAQALALGGTTEGGAATPASGEATGGAERQPPS